MNPRTAVGETRRNMELLPPSVAPKRSARLRGPPVGALQPAGEGGQNHVQAEGARISRARGHCNLVRLGDHCAAPLMAQTSSGQSWPTKRVQVIVPFSPGSATDLVPRALFEHVSAKVGQTFIIENRPGGGGAMGVSAVAKAEPDGHTSWSIPTRWSPPRRSRACRMIRCRTSPASRRWATSRWCW